MDDADVVAVDEEQDGGSVEGSSDARSGACGRRRGTAHVAGVGRGSSDPRLAVGVVVAGGGFGSRGRRRRAWIGVERSVGSVVVVDVDERVELGLEFGEGGAVGWVRSHFFMVSWKRSTLPQVVGWLA